MAPPPKIGYSNSNVSQKESGGKISKGPGEKSKAVTTPLPELSNTGLNYAITADDRKSRPKQTGNGYFETNYVKAIKMMSEKKFSDAERLFEDLSKRTSNPEEISIAKLCIAEIYFRNKSNAMALRMYKEIVKKYPNTQAAENAKAGISYLNNFEKYEKDYISPDVEDRKRRGF